MGTSITLIKIFGIPFKVNVTWIVIFGLVITSLAVYQFPDSYPRWSGFEYWLVAAATSVLFFLSVLLHELSHSLVAIRYGIPVKSITLFIFGGVAHISREAERPRIEAAIALAGPISSLLIAGAFVLLAYFAGSLNEQVEAMASWLAIINAGLAVFNLMPGFPMDGGRVFRSILWAITRNYLKATRISTLVGRGFAYLLIAGGAVSIFFGELASGIWLIFIGLFIDATAMATYRQAQRKEAFKQYGIDQLMTPLAFAPIATEDLPSVDASENANRVMEELEEKDISRALVVREGRVIGVITRDAFKMSRETEDQT